MHRVRGRPVVRAFHSLMQGKVTSWGNTFFFESSCLLSALSCTPLRYHHSLELSHLLEEGSQWLHYLPLPLTQTVLSRTENQMTSCLECVPPTVDIYYIHVHEYINVFTIPHGCRILTIACGFNFGTILEISMVTESWSHDRSSSAAFLRDMLRKSWPFTLRRRSPYLPQGGVCVCVCVCVCVHMLQL